MKLLLNNKRAEAEGLARICPPRVLYSWPIQRYSDSDPILEKEGIIDFIGWRNLDECLDGFKGYCDLVEEIKCDHPALKYNWEVLKVTIQGRVEAIGKYDENCGTFLELKGDYKDLSAKEDVAIKIKQYLKKPYARVLTPEEGGGFSAKSIEFYGCYSQGETVEEVYSNLEEAARNWLAACLAQGLEIPEPLEKDL